MPRSSAPAPRSSSLPRRPHRAGQPPQAASQRRDLNDDNWENINDLDFGDLTASSISAEEAARLAAARANRQPPAEPSLGLDAAMGQLPELDAISPQQQAQLTAAHRRAELQGERFLGRNDAPVNSAMASETESAAPSAPFPAAAPAVSTNGLPQGMGMTQGLAMPQGIGMGLPQGMPSGLQFSSPAQAVATAQQGRTQAQPFFGGAAQGQHPSPAPLAATSPRPVPMAPAAPAQPTMPHAALAEFSADPAMANVVMAQPRAFATGNSSTAFAATSPQEALAAAAAPLASAAQMAPTPAPVPTPTPTPAPYRAPSNLESAVEQVHHNIFGESFHKPPRPQPRSPKEFEVRPEEIQRRSAEIWGSSNNDTAPHAAAPALDAASALDATTATTAALSENIDANAVSGPSATSNNQGPSLSTRVFGTAGAAWQNGGVMPPAATSAGAEPVLNGTVSQALPTAGMGSVGTAAIFHQGTPESARSSGSAAREQSADDDMPLRNPNAPSTLINGLAFDFKNKTAEEVNQGIAAVIRNTPATPQTPMGTPLKTNPNSTLSYTQRAFAALNQLDANSTKISGISTALTQRQVRQEPNTNTLIMTSKTPAAAPSPQPQATASSLLNSLNERHTTTIFSDNRGRIVSDDLGRFTHESDLVNAGHPRQQGAFQFSAPTQGATSPNSAVTSTLSHGATAVSMAPHRNGSLTVDLTSSFGTLGEEYDPLGKAHLSASGTPSAAAQSANSDAAPQSSTSPAMTTAAAASTEPQENTTGNMSAIRELTPPFAAFDREESARPNNTSKLFSAGTTGASIISSDHDPSLMGPEDKDASSNHRASASPTATTFTTVDASSNATTEAAPHSLEALSQVISAAQSLKKEINQVSSSLGHKSSSYHPESSESEENAEFTATPVGGSGIASKREIPDIDTIFASLNSKSKEIEQQARATLPDLDLNEAKAKGLFKGEVPAKAPPSFTMAEQESEAEGATSDSSTSSTGAAAASASASASATADNATITEAAKELHTLQQELQQATTEVQELSADLQQQQQQQSTKESKWFNPLSGARPEMSNPLANPQHRDPGFTLSSEDDDSAAAAPLTAPAPAATPTSVAPAAAAPAVPAPAVPAAPVPAAPTAETISPAQPAGFVNTSSEQPSAAASAAPASAPAPTPASAPAAPTATAASPVTPQGAPAAVPAPATAVAPATAPALAPAAQASAATVEASPAAPAAAITVAPVVSDTSFDDSEDYEEDDSEEEDSEEVELNPAQQMIHNYLLRCHQGLDACTYFKGRGLSAEVATRFNLGYDAFYRTLPQNQLMTEMSAWQMQQLNNLETWQAAIIPLSADSFVAYKIATVNASGLALPSSWDLDERRYVGTMQCFNVQALSRSLYNHSPVFITGSEIDALSLESLNLPALALGHASNVGSLMLHLQQMVSNKSPEALSLNCYLALPSGALWHEAQVQLQRCCKELKLSCHVVDLNTPYSSINLCLLQNRTLLINKLYHLNDIADVQLQSAVAPSTSLNASSLVLSLENLAKLQLSPLLYTMASPAVALSRLVLACLVDNPQHQLIYAGSKMQWQMLCAMLTPQNGQNATSGNNAAGITGSEAVATCASVNATGILTPQLHTKFLELPLSLSADDIEQTLRHGLTMARLNGMQELTLMVDTFALDLNLCAQISARIARLPTEFEIPVMVWCSLEQKHLFEGNSLQTIEMAQGRENEIVFLTLDSSCRQHRFSTFQGY